MSKKNGKVYIVGAGPGGENLVTLKAIEAVRSSDVVLYDELANQNLLASAPSHAKLIYVGKKAGCHSVSQEDTEKMLVQFAGAGNVVCRLKGGDPFMLGRGGEEMETLRANGIEYEVVPGVTSALSAPAYAGIPVTHRGLSSGVAIFTGHEDPAKGQSDLNWSAMAGLGATLVFLMGMKNLAEIARNLIVHGMDEGTPVAVIHRGATPLQRTVTGTLKDISSIVEREKIGAPSVIVVGKVVDLRERLAWFESRPLFGKKILVTRSRKQASVLASKLKDRGASVSEFPTIEIEPSEAGLSELDLALRDTAGFDWVIFTSANAVEIFFGRMLKQGLDARVLAKAKICAIGPATSEKLSEYFVKADLMPEEYIAESIYNSLKGKVSGKKILLPRSDIARRDLVELLERDGASVTEIPVYRTVVPEAFADELRDIVSSVDLVTFTSSSTAENFAKIMGGAVLGLEGRKIAASIGPVTTSAIRGTGLGVACEAKEYTIDGLVEAIVDHFGPVHCKVNS